MKSKKTKSPSTTKMSLSVTVHTHSPLRITHSRSLAAKIDRKIGKTDAPLPPDEQQKRIDQSGFQPYKTTHRKPGTGGVYQLNDHLWEGKYSPTDAHGKRICKNVYAPTREECEEKLAVMIEKVKKEIANEKEKLKEYTN